MSSQTELLRLLRLAWISDHVTADDCKKIDTLLAATAEDVRAVVDEQDLFESVFQMPAHTTRFKGGYAATEFNAWAAHEFVKKWDGWKARAKFNS